MIYRSHQSRRGFTLVELLVAVALFSILVSIGVGGFTSALRAQRQAAALLSAQSNVDLAIEEIAREVRTGYLFCHDLDSVVPSPTCGCVVSQSDFSDPSAPGALPGGALPVWTCNSLEYLNGNGEDVQYVLQGGTIQKGVGGAFQEMTGNNVSVKNLTFTLFGNTEGDHWTPRVTMDVGIAPSSTDPVLSNNVLDLQTSISARSIDCSASGGTPSC